MTAATTDAGILRAIHARARLIIDLGDYHRLRARAIRLRDGDSASRAHLCISRALCIARECSRRLAARGEGV
jgi:hypothetical protein